MANLDTIAFKNIIERLDTEENKQNVLNDLKHSLEYKPKPVAVSTIKSAGISKIVQCLNEPDGIQTNLTCELLKICFEKFEPGEFIKNYTSHFMYLLRHEKCCVRKLAIDEVYKTVSTDITLLHVSDYIDLFVAVAQLVCDSDLGIANKALNITSILPNEAYPKVLEEMKIALECGKSSKCNAFEVISNLSTKSFELFQLCTAEGYIDYMVAELSSDDIVYQLNILELLSLIAVKPYGITYFVKSGVLEKVNNLIASLQNNQFKGLFTQGYIKFFGSIAHYYPKEIFEKYPVVVDVLFDALESKDLIVQLAGIDTLGFIGSTIEGKLCLAALGGRYIQALEKLGELEKHGLSEIKDRILISFAQMIRVDKDSEQYNKYPNRQRIDLMTREWFRYFSRDPEPMERLLTLCNSPFSDITLGALELLESVCQHTWGEELVAGTAGLIEYLLFRSVDDSKNVKEAKFKIIKCLSTSTAFDANIIERLQTYVEQGPFYSETQLQVAIEDGN